MADAHAIVADAATQLHAQNLQLREEMKAAALKEGRENERRRRQRRRSSIAYQKKLNARVQRALQGLESLLALGASPEFQLLIKERRKPLVVYDGSEVSSLPEHGTYKWIGFIALTPTHLRIASYHGYMEGHIFKKRTDTELLHATLLYEVKDSFLRTLLLHKMAALAPNQGEIDIHDPNFTASIQVLFNVLVQCGSPDQFASWVKNALDHPRAIAA